ncbi:hypothetical protein MCOR25_006562 [Pyricularia grisea]|nr:hypothetical protein MCOR25_006562 [Pyricularia grisea]
MRPLVWWSDLKWLQRYIAGIQTSLKEARALKLQILEQAISLVAVGFVLAPAFFW